MCAPKTQKESTFFAKLRNSTLRLLPIIAISLLPVALTHELWLGLLRATSVRSWDGTGHYAAAQIYAETIFPNTFGWTDAYFGGMPLPNFYPPLFYWLVGLAHATHIFSFNSAFKLVFVVPVLLTPAAISLVAFTASDRNWTVAICAAFASVPMLIDPRFVAGIGPSGLDYSSTFVLGLYSQPLGFVLLALWYAAFVKASAGRSWFILSTILLALTVLANFFNAVTAGIFVATILTGDLVSLFTAKDHGHRLHTLHRLAAHLLSPFLSACLCAFWLVPVLYEYDYFVTRPVKVISFAATIPYAAWLWFVAAELGITCWFFRRSREMWAFVATCLLLGAMVVFDTVFAPRWFPLQSTRILATLNFLLCIPVGQALATIYLKTVSLLGDFLPLHSTASDKNDLWRRRSIIPKLIFSVLLVAFSAILYKSAHGALSVALSFYSDANNQQVTDVLAFAKEHSNGRYLVESPNVILASGADLDGRAIASGLGSQGNESLIGVFREASPNSLFYNPAVSVFSAFPEGFGISSTLADDLDFMNQPTSRHLERLSRLGVRYLVIYTPTIKQRLSLESQIAVKYDIGKWSVFELKQEPASLGQVLSYRPALVISRFTVKQRRRNEYNFIRFAEEQFYDDWFDVLLARSPEVRLDHIGSVDDFGAVLVDSYDCDNEDTAVDWIRNISKGKLVILLSSDAPLFRRIASDIAAFPHAKIVERIAEPSGEWMESETPTFRYDTSNIRKVWARIKKLLIEQEVPISQNAKIVISRDQNAIAFSPATPLYERVPVMLNTTFHPDWKREDTGAIYAVTPFNMLTFADRPVRLTYGRSPVEKWAVALSAVTLILLILSPGLAKSFGPLKRRRS